MRYATIYFLYNKILTYHRLKDEKQVAAIIDKVQEYLERQGTVSELCRVYLRKIEHLYYKFDSNVLKQKDVSLAKYSFAHKIFLFDLIIEFIIRVNWDQT